MSKATSGSGRNQASSARCHLAHGRSPAGDLAVVVGVAAAIARSARPGSDPRHRHQVAAPNGPLALHAALLVAALNPGQAIEAVEAVMGPQRHETLVLHRPGPTAP